jgi:hypothetical protein
LEAVSSAWSMLKLCTEDWWAKWVDACVCGKGRVTSSSQTPPTLEEEAPLLNMYMSRREPKSWSWISWRPEARNDYAGKDQQQFNRLTDWTEGHSVRGQSQRLAILSCIFWQPLPSSNQWTEDFVCCSCDLLESVNQWGCYRYM